MFDVYQARTRKVADANTTSMRVILALYMAFLLLGSLLLAAASLLFSRTVVSPIHRLAEATRAVADGDLGRRVSVTSRDEIGQLSHTFNLMAARLEEQRAQLQHLASLEERHRIAMDLHDGVLQAVYGIGLTLEACAEDFRQDPDQARQRLERARNDVDRVIQDIRKHFVDPGPAPPSDGATREMLAGVVEAFREGSGISAALQVEVNRELPPVHAMHLAWIVQEALANVRRHAGANSVAVRLAQEGDGLRLSIRDDGAGFSVAEARRGAGRGLRNMAERARAMGGTLTVEGASDRGTEVVVLVPLDSGRTG
jgi:signal transduction histidine kinase